jgi:hypothetical protein
MGSQMLHKRLYNERKTIGFVTENSEPGQGAWILCRSFLTSEEEDFYTYIDPITYNYLKKAGIRDSQTYTFLILHHEDSSVDIYVNELPICVEFMAKRDVQKGESVMTNDIADIRRLQFQGIDIKNTDNIIFCFKSGWKFGLFFDLTYQDFKSPKLDLEKLYLDLGTHYKRLSFDYLYKVIENVGHFDDMRKDGWFPYVELIGVDYKELSKAYVDKLSFPQVVNKLLESFEKKRIDRISSKWWRSPIYYKKKKLLTAGLNAYLQNNEEGFINCIKTLYSEIEGILRLLHVEELNKDTNSTAELTALLALKGSQRSKGKDPMLFPDFFQSFLQEYLFPRFDLIKNEVGLSRHTSGHGVAEPDAYTKLRALQAILILDQIYFFIPPKK